MRLILAQPAIPRFQWELDVLLTNIRQFTDMEVVLLFTEHDFTVPIHFREKWGCTVFVYTDRRDDTNYIPSVRPWLLWQFFEEDSFREQEPYFYIDSDIIFRQWPDFTKMDLDSKTVYGANCGSYIGLDYILGCESGSAIAENMGQICGITVDQMKGVAGVGAQLITQKNSAAFWKRCYFDSNALYHYLESIGSNVQTWTAEMWAQLWGWVREGFIVEHSTELDFCTPLDLIGRWDEVNILHNAGVNANRSHELFFKGQYVQSSPLGKNLSWVSSKYASRKYADAVESVVV